MPTSRRIISLQIIKHEIFTSNSLFLKNELWEISVRIFSKFYFMHSKQMTVRSGLTGFTLTAQAAKSKFLMAYGGFSYMHSIFIPAASSQVTRMIIFKYLQLQ